jgi:hypothetical protein
LLKSKDNKKAQTAANDAVAAMPDKPEILDARQGADDYR